MNCMSQLHLVFVCLLGRLRGIFPAVLIMNQVTGLGVYSVVVDVADNSVIVLCTVC